jgi:hypothetical protein
MTLIAVLSYNIEPEKVKFKDWLIWLTAPVTAPIFLIFYLTKYKKR